jgi:hypothetical protein
VTLTPEGRIYVLPPTGRPLADAGKVVGFGRRHYNDVRVLRDGHATPETFHMDFWGPA